MSTADKIIREIERLPEPLAREVLDFIGYIGLKDRLTEETKQAQEPGAVTGCTRHCGRPFRRGVAQGELDPIRQGIHALCEQHRKGHRHSRACNPQESTCRAVHDCGFFATMTA